MTASRLYITLFSLVLLMSRSPSVAATNPIYVSEFQEIPSVGHVHVLVSDDAPSPISKKAPFENGTDTICINHDDILPHASITTVNALTFAIVIGVLNSDIANQTVYEDPVPRHTVLHRILFRSLISPNAP